MDLLCYGQRAPERTVLIGKHGEAEEKEEGRKEGKRRNKVNEKIRAVLILTQKAILLTWVIPAAFLEVMKREFKVIPGF